MNEEYRKIGIVLEKNKKGEYSFRSVEVFADENDEILYNSNIAELDAVRLEKLRNKEETRVVFSDVEDKKYVSLVITEQLFNLLIEKCQKDKLDYAESIKSIREMLEIIAGNIETISSEQINNMLSVKFEYKNPEEVLSNENEPEDHIVFDMSKINPSEIYEKIRKKVIAQDRALNTVIKNIYNNQKIFETGDEDLISSSKASILMDGPTGTGKTLIIKQVAKEMGLPMIVRSSTIYSSAGYTGDNLKETLVALLDTTKGDLAKAERGIVVLDEFDKLGKEKDDKEQLAMKKAVQQDLLSYMSGAKFPVEYKGRTIEFDTSKLTFICIGAFTDLRERKISEGLNEQGQYTMTEEDYIGQGILREVMGRFSLLTATQALSKEDMITILKRSEISPLIQLQNLGETVYNKKIICSDEMAEIIAEEAVKKNTGARALQNVINGIRDVILDQLIYEDMKEIEITPEMLEKAKAIENRDATDSEKRKIIDEV